ncbi:hypothetical protein IV86_GL001135 [Pediococcus pentosaceus]|nr:hypothetical protein IV86_GL001135 [Pediococcus pentosaceus]
MFESSGDNCMATDAMVEPPITTIVLLPSGNNFASASFKIVPSCFVTASPSARSPRTIKHLSMSKRSANSFSWLVKPKNRLATGSRPFITRRPSSESIIPACELVNNPCVFNTSVCDLSTRSLRCRCSDKTLLPTGASRSIDFKISNLCRNSPIKPGTTDSNKSISLSSMLSPVVGLVLSSSATKRPNKLKINGTQTQELTFVVYLTYELNYNKPPSFLQI